MFGFGDSFFWTVMAGAKRTFTAEAVAELLMNYDSEEEDNSSVHSFDSDSESSGGEVTALHSDVESESETDDPVARCIER